ncbi:SLAM family member 8-like isoform 1-T1 [Hipposideros larvatus]
MGPCCEDPHLLWASWLLGLAELAGVLLGVCGTGPLSSGGADSRAHVSLKRVRGGSVLFHVTRELEGDAEAQLEEMAWGFGPETTYRVLLQVVRGGDLPTWVSFQDKYRHRVHVPNMRSLLIANLTPEDSGQYRARGSFTGGGEFTQVFQLTVYEPVPLPQILAKSLSVTADWCNVTLECRAVGASEDLNVTWWSSDLPRKWQQTGTLGPGPSIWALAVRLPLDQSNTSLTCNASNEVDLKTATSTLGDICAQERLEVTPNSCLHLNVSHHRALLCTLGPADPGGRLPPTPTVTQSRLLDTEPGLCHFLCRLWGWSLEAP